MIPISVRSILILVSHLRLDHLYDNFFNKDVKIYFSSWYNVKFMWISVISAVAYWLVGYALGHGEGNSVIGLTYWAGAGVPADMRAHLFFHYIFAATAATIISGAVCERCNYVAYIAYSAIISGKFRYNEKIHRPPPHTHTHIYIYLRMRWAGYVAKMKESRSASKFWQVNLQERYL